jgi:hypothetical protein
MCETPISSGQKKSRGSGSVLETNGIEKPSDVQAALGSFYEKDIPE